jgi:SET and MYND domain-containing protein 4
MSSEMKEIGNMWYQECEFYKALYCYNDALLTAVNEESNNDIIPLLYGNRSAVYFKVKQYENCLENIKLAKENGYTINQAKLDKREELAKKLLEQQTKDPEDDPMTFFKLSYPVNPKIPFIVSCLELRETEIYGRGIYTTRDLKPGDVLSLEEPAIYHIMMQGFYRRCANCCKPNNLNLTPTTLNCRFVLFLFQPEIDLIPFYLTNSDVLL